MFIYILYILAIFITIYFVSQKKKIEEALTLAVTDNNEVVEYGEIDKTTSLYGGRDFKKVITSTKDNYWALDNSGKSWHKTPSSSWVKKEKSGVTFVDITSDEDDVWGLTGRGDYAVYKRPVNSTGNWVIQSNETNNKKFIQMSASGNGWIWAVDKDNVAWKKETASTKSWEREMATNVNIKQVSCGENYVFALTGSGENKLYKKNINGSGTWNILNKKLKYVSGSSKTYLWGVDETKKVVRAVKPVDRNSIWEEVPHSTKTFKYISGTNMQENKKNITPPVAETEEEAAAREAARVEAAGSGTRAAAANTRSTPEGTSTETCSLNCAAPTKITGSCEGVSTLNPNPFAKDVSGTIKYFKACPYTCLGPQDAGWNNYGPATGVTYDKDIHGCRYTQQCKQCGTVDIEAQGEMKETIENGEYKYKWVDATSTETGALPFDQNRQLTQCEIDKMQGLHNNNCPPPTEYTSSEESKDNYNTDGTVNAADTTMANMFLDINNPHHTGTQDMSLDDYYKRRLLVNSGENRLGGSKSAYTNKYKPQDRFGKIRFFNSVWKLF
jgi:hypothetical protein